MRYNVLMVVSCILTNILEQKQILLHLVGLFIITTRDDLIVFTVR